MKIRLVALKKDGTGTTVIHDIVEFEPVFTKDNKFDAASQRCFDRALRYVMYHGMKVTIERANP